MVVVVVVVVESLCAWWWKVPVLPIIGTDPRNSK
jgi:hypothetical protein